MALFRLGFRPFYSGAAVFATVAMCLWLFVLGGKAQTGNYLSGVVWHSHEMLFGFATAVLAGFLLTAVRNWTGRPTPVGMPLMLLSLVWLLARLLMLFGPPELAAIVDSAFLPLLGAAVGIPIVASRNRRNYKLLLIVAVLALLNISFHLATMGYAASWLSQTALIAAIDMFVVLMAVVGGRVTLAFIQNAIPDASPRSESWVEILSFATLIAAVVSSLLAGVWTLPTTLATLLFAVAAIAQAVRLFLWEAWRAIGNPLLWMLPAAYSWIPLAFLLRALAAQGVVAQSVWIHAVTTGAISGLMLAMMMRSTLGHTGRKLIASGLDMSAFVILQMAAVARLMAGVVSADYYLATIKASGFLWVLAFLLFALRYLPMLLRPRIDGRPG